MFSPRSNSAALTDKQTGAHSFVRKAAGIKMEGAQTGEVTVPIDRATCLRTSSDQVWGAVDFTPSPESNFPDWRNITTITGDGVSIFLIPHPRGTVRLYVELGAEKDIIDPTTGRVDMTRYSAERLLVVGHTYKCLLLAL